MHGGPSELTALLLALGPWLVLVMTLTETALFIGLLLPAEATVLLAAFLAEEGVFSLEQIVAATLGGAFLGDQIGYLLGRTSSHRVVAARGRLGRLWRRYEPVVGRLFAERAAAAVAIGRFISFVRTLMPWFAGASRMPYPRFLVFDIIGVTGWGLASIALGYAAGESWDLVAGWLGTASAAILVIGAGMAILAVRRARRRRGTDGPELMRIGLTGNIASGKSSVAEVWKRLGAAIIDADVLARRAVEPGTDALRRVVDRFGPDVLAADGTLDRGTLRRRVFDDDEARRALEAIIHPEVARLRDEEEARLRAEGARIVVLDIPLLFEAGLEDRVDVIVLVDAPEAERVARLQRDRGLDEAQARAMVDAQMPASRKRPEADYIIENDGSRATLVDRAEEIWRTLESRVPSA